MDHHQVDRRDTLSYITAPVNLLNEWTGMDMNGVVMEKRKTQRQTEQKRQQLLLLLMLLFERNRYSEASVRAVSPSFPSHESGCNCHCTRLAAGGADPEEDTEVRSKLLERIAPSLQCGLAICNNYYTAVIGRERVR